MRALELSEAPEDVEEELPVRGGRIQRRNVEANEP
jgi:hypothetical protein